MARSRRSSPHTVTAERAYMQALGRFIHEFSAVEATMHHLLCRCAGVSDDIGSAVFSGVRSDVAMSFIRRVIRTASPDPPRDADLLQAFDQLALINSFRNELVHFGGNVYAGPDHRFISNAVKALKPDWQFREVSPAILRAMTFDLTKIREHLFAYAGSGAALGRFYKPTARLLAASWRYKPGPIHRTGGSARQNSHPKKK